MKERSISVREALHEAPRIGFTSKQSGGARKFSQKTFRMGAGHEFRWDKAMAIANAIEDEEITRRISILK